MTQSTFWKILAVALVLSLLYIGYGLHSREEGLSLVQTAQAQVVSRGAMGGGDLLITQSADGQTLYLWTFGPGVVDPLRSPSFNRTVEAR